MEFEKWMEALHPDSPVREYLRWMNASGNDALYREKYADIRAAQAGDKECFLTVVIRTQGRRTEMLQDVLTCLQAQRDPDFEVVLVCHRAGEDGKRAVAGLIARQEQSFRERVRQVSLDSGERGAPLNLGFALARGEYAVCLDDDDLVLDHWVEVFHRAAAEHAGMILHSWALTQHWQADEAPDGSRRLRASGSPDAKYCVPWRTLNQQSENSCPFMGMAFPMFLFRQLHVMFDETLTTTEDWDWLLRTAGIAGVWDTGEITAIYRLWNTEDASRQLIREPEWKENYRQIGERMNGMPLLLTARETAESREELTGLQSAGRKGRSCFLREAVMFWSDGGEFSDSRYTTAPIQMKDGWIRARFTVRKQAEGEKIRRIRIDPAEEAMFTLEHVRVRMLDGKEKIGELGAEQIRETNGLTEGDRILFLAEDPRIVFQTEKEMPPCTVEFTARVTYHSPAALSAWAEDLCADARWLADNRNRAHLYLDRGNGFTAGDSLEREGVFGKNGYSAGFDIPAEKADNIMELRFDPTEAEMLWMDGIGVRMEYADGTADNLRAQDIPRANGFVSGEGIAFVARDPNLRLIPAAGKKLARVTVTAAAEFIRAERMEDLFAAAGRVWNYEEICAQLKDMRQNRWKEEAENGHEADDA